jgi:hypothetical protein
MQLTYNEIYAAIFGRKMQSIVKVSRITTFDNQQVMDG